MDKKIQVKLETLREQLELIAVKIAEIGLPLRQAEHLTEALDNVCDVIDEVLGEEI